MSTLAATDWERMAVHRGIMVTQLDAVRTRADDLAYLLRVVASEWTEAVPSARMGLLAAVRGYEDAVAEYETVCSGRCCAER